MFLLLQNHDIVFLYPEDMDIEKTPIGRWLHENLVEYRIHKFKKIYDLLYEKFYINVVQIQFFQESDMIAFKLTWAGKNPKPTVI